MAQLIEFMQNWHGIGRFFAVLGVTLAASLVVVAIAFQTLRRLAARTRTSVDDDMLEGLRWPARLLAVFVALSLAVFDLDERVVPQSLQVFLARLLAILIWVAVTVALSRVAIIGLTYWLRKHPDSQGVTTLTRSAVTMICAIPAILGLLNTFNVNLAPALTALGVGGIAVSLALKDTLANLFSGFSVSLGGNVRRGDYIRVEGGFEGWVEDIRWRNTTIRTQQENLITIPNSKLAEAVVINFSQPSKPMTVAIPLSVAYSTDIDKLEKAVLEEVALVGSQLPALLSKPAPVLRLNPGFGESGLNLTLSVQVSQFESQGVVTDTIRRRLLVRFRKEGITIPVPIKGIEILPPSSPA